MIRPDFNLPVMLDFQGAKITSEVGFLLMREIDCFKIIAPMRDCLEELRSSTHSEHLFVSLIRQRIYQIGAGYEDCNDASFLRKDPAPAGFWQRSSGWGWQSMMWRLKNDILGNGMG